MKYWKVKNVKVLSYELLSYIFFNFFYPCNHLFYAPANEATLKLKCYNNIRF